MNSEISQISTAISRADPRYETAKLRNLLSKLMLLIHNGYNASGLMGHITKLLPSNDVVIKKFACFFINKYAHEIPDISYLVSNTLQKDCRDANPLIRSLALQTCCTIPTLAEHSQHIVSQALQDGSPYVRRNAVFSCTRTYQHTPTVIIDQGLVDDLYSILRDSDPLVVCNGLIALEEILQLEGGVVINRNIAFYLLGRLSSFTEWNLVHVFHALQKYVPQNEQEVLSMMNFLDPYLTHSNSSVVVAAIKLFLHLASDLPHLKDDLLLQVQKHLCSFIKFSNPELSYLMLLFVEELIEENVHVFSSSYRNFFCHYNDPLHIKEKKISLLPKLVNEKNVMAILEEIRMYCLDISLQVSVAAIKALGTIAKLRASSREMCLNRLFGLLELEQEFITTQVLQVFQTLELTREEVEDNLKHIIHHIITVSNYKGQTALLWLLGEYCIDMEESPYFIEQILRTAEENEESSVAVKRSLLMAAMKMFFHRPAECQHLLGHILEIGFKDQDASIRDRAKFYYKLLQMDVSLAKKLICSQR